MYFCFGALRFSFWNRSALEKSSFSVVFVCFGFVIIMLISFLLDFNEFFDLIDFSLFVFVCFGEGFGKLLDRFGSFLSFCGGIEGVLNSVISLLL